MVGAMMMPRLLLVFLLAALPGLTRAQSLEVPVTVEVLSGWRQGDTHIAGFRINLTDGWKTYWRAPGEGGIPPRLTIDTADNIGGYGIAFPLPQVFETAGFTNIGYTETVVIPVQFALTSADDKASVSGVFDIGVCEEICVPFSVDFALDLAPDQTRRDPHIVAALVDRPRAATSLGLGPARCRLTPEKDRIIVDMTATVPGLSKNSLAVVESLQNDLWIAQLGTEISGTSIAAKAEAFALDGGAAAMDRAGIRLTIIEDNRAIEFTGCLAG